MKASAIVSRLWISLLGVLLIVNAGEAAPLRVAYSAISGAMSPLWVAQEGGYSLGAQAGEEPLRRLAYAAGFSQFRRLAQTPFTAVYEARR